MKKVTLAMFILTACGRGDDSPAAPSDLEQLDAKLASALSYAPICTYEDMGKAPMKGGCDDGDGLLWSRPLLCESHTVCLFVCL